MPRSSASTRLQPPPQGRSALQHRGVGIRREEGLDLPADGGVGVGVDVDDIVVGRVVNSAEQPLELIGKAVHQQQIGDHAAPRSCRRDETGDANACRADSSGSLVMGDFFEGWPYRNGSTAGEGRFALGDHRST
jgi:hypothetical protein